MIYHQPTSPVKVQDIVSKLVITLRMKEGSYGNGKIIQETLAFRHTSRVGTLDCAERWSRYTVQVESGAKSAPWKKKSFNSRVKIAWTPATMHTSRKALFVRDG